MKSTLWPNRSVTTRIDCLISWWKDKSGITKKTSLTELDVTIEKLRLKLMLAYELGYFAFRQKGDAAERSEVVSEKRYGVLTVMLDEIGRIIGGWIKKVKESQQW